MNILGAGASAATMALCPARAAEGSGTAAGRGRVLNLADHGRHGPPDPGGGAALHGGGATGTDGAGCDCAAYIVKPPPENLTICQIIQQKQR
jgi:hypothetical protein